ncbi:MAG: nitrogenase iron-molybdenum cofactor biosynthesis protein NifE [Endomicrobium sp.]|jgi:nitrogenase molybdenum-cofactor synthesis protein NifE|nr:nitrogenase iron-molybdenum cofactor biosynthesis protein NifE [Endomicrobium sp.]
MSLNKDGVLTEREGFIKYGSCGGDMKCGGESLAGAVSQRACVYCGARVVLNPISDAYHIVHGPIGCASYTWDIRGSLSSGSDLYRNSFSTDLSEKEVIFGGIKKLTAAVDEICANYSPKLIFIYSTCIVGVIGDDVESVCRYAESKYNTRVINVKSPGFSGAKMQGYKAACDALMKLMEGSAPSGAAGKAGGGVSVNILGDFNLAGEIWIISNYLKEIGVEVISKFTGDSKYEEIIKAPKAALNIVQCAGSMTYLAKTMEDVFGVPYIKVSFFGVDDVCASLLRIAQFFNNDEILKKAKALILRMSPKTKAELDKYIPLLRGRKAAIYVGGGFKAISLINQFKELGMKTVLAGTQTGKKEDYEIISSLVDSDAVVLDDANPSELEKFMIQKGADILVGGVKERPLAYKLGVAFCDHNHERKYALAGFEGAVNFAKEISESLNSPVWKFLRQ